MTPDKLVETVARATRNRLGTASVDLSRLPPLARARLLVDARSAILATLEGIRKPPTETLLAMVNTIDDHSGRLHSRKWEAAIDRLIADVKGPPHG